VSSYGVRKKGSIIPVKTITLITPNLALCNSPLQIHTAFSAPVNFYVPLDEIELFR
jgi:hypothetical protein